MTPDLAGVSVVLEGCSAADLPLLTVTCVPLLHPCTAPPPPPLPPLSQGSRALGTCNGTRSIFKFHPSYALRPRALNLKNCGHLARNTGGMMGRRERLRSRPRKEEEEEECVGGSY